MTTNLLILGASARAAAMSADLCGYEIWCADRFADADLGAIAEVELCENYPDALPRMMADAPSGPWMYTGALENRPDLLEMMISKRHPLLGNTPDVVRLVREPANWTTVLKQAMLPYAEIQSIPVRFPLDGSWLMKPFRGGSGAGIKIWNEQSAKEFSLSHDVGSSLGGTGGLPNSENTRHFFWQRFVPGIPIAAIYVAAKRSAVLLGTTRQLIGESWCRGEEPQTLTGIESSASSTYPNRNGFAYCGSVGPLHLDDNLTEQLQAIGSVFAREFNIKGLFGVDAMWRPDGNIVPVEINPRYTASIEVLERASLLGTVGTRGKQLKAIQLHVEACQDGKLPERVIPASSAIVAKAILFMPIDSIQRSKSAYRFSSAVAQWAAMRNLSAVRPTVADIPQAESPLYPGQPILTLLAEGKNETEVMSELLVQAAECYDLLREWNDEH